MITLDDALVPVPVDGKGIPRTDGTRISRNSVAAYLRVRDMPYVARGQVRPVLANTDLLRERLKRIGRENDESIRLPLFDVDAAALIRRSRDAHVHHDEITCQAAEMALAEHRGQPPVLGGTAVFTISGNDVHLSLDCPGWAFRMWPVGEGLHVFYRVDFGGLPQRIHPEGPRRLIEQGRRRARRPTAQRTPGRVVGAPGNATRDALGRVLIRVAVAFTRQCAQTVRAMHAGWSSGEAPFAYLAQSYLCRTNAAFDLSGLRVHLVLADVDTTSVDESIPGEPNAPASAIGQMLLDPTRPELAGVIDWWSKTGAQSLVLVGELGGLGNPDNYGGSTYTGWTPVTSDRLASLFEDPPDRPGMRGFSVVNRACADNEHSFAHEIGHQLGLQHERGAATGGSVQILDLPTLALLDHGYGHVHPDPRAFTIMALGEGGADRQCRAPIFSTTGALDGPSPNASIAAWGSAAADNVALANELAPFFACRTPPGR